MRISQLKKYSLLFLGLAVLVFVASYADKKVESQSDTRIIQGWIWGDLMGRTLLNNYMLIPEASGGHSVKASSGGILSGYAWSDLRGWISFNGGADLVGCPGATDPRIDLNTGKITGWARAISGKNRTDGWDGCIELSGTNHPSPVADGTQGVTYNKATNRINGFAWGGQALGWMQFNAECTQCDQLIPGPSFQCKNIRNATNPDGTVNKVTLQVEFTPLSAYSNYRVDWNVDTSAEIRSFGYGQVNVQTIEVELPDPGQNNVERDYNATDDTLVKVRVTDNSNPNAVFYGECPSFKLTRYPSQQNIEPEPKIISTKLYIAKTFPTNISADTSVDSPYLDPSRPYKYLRIKKGTGFKLHANINTQGEVSCRLFPRPQNSPFSGRSGSDVSWSGDNAVAYDNAVPKVDTQSKVFSDTNNVPTGRYEFELNCTGYDVGSFSRVRLDIVESAIEEI